MIFLLVFFFLVLTIVTYKLFKGVTNVIVFVSLDYIFYKLNFKSLFGKNKIYLYENKKE